MLNQDRGAGVACCLENKQTPCGILSFDVYCECRHTLWLVAQGKTNFSDTWTLALPSPFISGAMAFRVLTACLVSFICSCSSFPVLSLSLFPLPRSGWLSGRKIASFLAQDYPELWVPCNCPRPFLSLQPRRRVTDCWLRAPRCLLPNDCYKF